MRQGERKKGRERERVMKRVRGSVREREREREREGERERGRERGRERKPLVQRHHPFLFKRQVEISWGKKEDAGVKRHAPQHFFRIPFGMKFKTADFSPLFFP